MIAPGVILIKKGARLPESLRLDASSHSSGWSALANNPDNHQVEKDLANAGWTFFYMAGATTKTSFGFDHTRMMGSAVKRLLANVTRQKFNCIEIDTVKTSSFWGIPFVSVSAHSRHIQKDLLFSSDTSGPVA